jgi:hypothetical protein
VNREVPPRDRYRPRGAVRRGYRGAGPAMVRVLHVCPGSAVEELTPTTGRPSRWRDGPFCSTP